MGDLKVDWKKWNEQQCEECHDKLSSLEEQAQALVEANRNMLINFSLDWYVEMMGRSEAPTRNSSGISAKIHNLELNDRINTAIHNMRKTLEAYEAWKRGKS